MSLADFLYEMCSLKNVPRAGWLKLGIEKPESVAEHSFLSAVIAFFLALRTFKDIDKACFCAVLALFHDIHESRTLDLHKLARRYVEVDEDRVLSEMLDFYEGRLLKGVMKDCQEIVHDADKIELFIQSKVYSLFNDSARVYGENLELRTSEGKKLFEELKNTDPRWWLKFEVHS